MISDLVLLSEPITDSSVVETLKKRFEVKKIYTNIGPTLLSINPHRKISALYGPDVIRGYTSSGDSAFKQKEPHIYSIAETAFARLRRDAEDQCVLVTGESGSGKTENAKRILEFISTVNESESHFTSSLNTALLSSNPVLEAFGNARTLRNDNSSRFGKYMEISYNSKHHPVQANITNYLLETTRVVSQNSGEQNFHVFYYLLEAADSKTKRDFHLEGFDCTSFQCLGNKARDTQGDITLAILKKGMTAINLDSAIQDNIFRIVATILHLQNINFLDDAAAGQDSGKSGSRIDPTTQAHVEAAASLLNIDNVESLVKAFTERILLVGCDAVTKVLHADEARKTRDALSKNLYGRTFEYLVTNINDKMKFGSPGDCHQNSLGILDIYGFEIFETNSFEQLCINYCNEKLQQLFIELTLRVEQAEYVEEGLAWEPVEFFNNKAVCDLIENPKPKPSLLCLLNEECSLLGKVDDETLLKKFDLVLQDNDHYVNIKTSRRDFTIKHYAGDVRYCTTSFLAKNKDTLFRELIDLAGNSSNTFIQGLFPESRDRRSQKKPATVGTKFKAQMMALLSRLETARPHFVRCINTNRGKFDAEDVATQVQYLGLLENVKVKRAGYAYRSLKSSFLHKYKMTCKETWPSFEGSEDDAIKCILSEFDEKDYALGNTKVFLQPVILFALAERRAKQLRVLVTTLQSAWRGYKHKCELQILREKATSLFHGKKRRLRSFRHVYVGDYIDAGLSKSVTGSSIGQNAILFADTVQKINRNGKIDNRAIVLTTQSCCFFKSDSKTFQPKALTRTVPLGTITEIRLSSFADGFVCLHIESGPSVLFHSPRKSELLTQLMALGMKVTFNNRFDFVACKSNFQKSAFESKFIEFVESATNDLQPGELMPHFSVNKKAKTIQVFIPPKLGANACIQLRV